MIHSILNSLKKFLKKKSFVFLVVILILYKSIFNVFTGKYLLTYIFKNYSTGSFEGSVNQFSLFYGIEIEKIVIRSGADFNNEVLFSCERLALLYNLPYLFGGKLKLSEISLTKPFLQVLERNSKLNVVELFPSKGVKEEKPKESKPLPAEVNVYLPLSAYLNFFIQDFHFRMEKEQGEHFFTTEEKDLDLKILIATKRFRKIPLDVSIVNLFETIEIVLNPKRDLQVLFRDNHNEINQPISSSLGIILDSEKNPPEFHSNLKLGSDQVGLTVKNRKLPSFALQASYELDYLPKEDSLVLDNLSIQFDKAEWIRAKGKILKALTEEREFAIQIYESKIDLLPVASIYKQIPGLPDFDFKGKLELAPIEVKGKMNSLDVTADIKAREFLLKQKNKSHSVPFLNLNAAANLDLATKKEPTKENPVPFLNSAKLKADLSYNTMLADIKAEIENEKKISILLNLKNLILGNFTKAVTGNLSGTVSVDGNSFSSLNAKLDSRLRTMEYFVGSSKSGINHIDLLLAGKVSLGEKFSFQSLDVNNLSAKLKNPEMMESVGIAANGKLSMSPSLDVNLDKLSFSTDLNKLIPILPLSLKEQIAPLKKTLGVNPSLSGKVRYTNLANYMQVDGDIKIAVPGLNLNDIKTDLSVQIKKDTSGEISISKFDISALRGVLKGKLNGSLAKRVTTDKPPLGAYFPSLSLNLLMNSENQIEIVNGVKFDGRIALDVNLTDYIAKGKLDSKNSNFVYYSGTCKENDYTNCNLLYINRINIDLPFEHSLKITNTKNLIEGNKAKYISTYGQNLPSNLTIQNVVGTHPYIQNDLFKFLQESSSQPGLAARLDYRENVLYLNALRISTLDGFIFGKDILFNVGSANAEEMEYAAAIQIKDIDLKQLLPEKSRKGIADGKIRADINLSGRNLKDPIGNLNLFFSVFKIGEDFGRSAIRIISPPNLLTDGIISSYSQINKIEIELSKGLVYADILFQRSVLSSVFLSIENNKISQERMPLANFLNRAQSEVSKYE